MMFSRDGAAIRKIEKGHWVGTCDQHRRDETPEEPLHLAQGSLQVIDWLLTVQNLAVPVPQCSALPQSMNLEVL
jgi:hypothetical protein